MTRYVLTFEPITSREGDPWRMAPPDVRVRRLLKAALRGLGLRCVHAKEDRPVSSVRVRFVLLEGIDDHPGPTLDLPALPAEGDGVRFSPLAIASVCRRWLNLDEGGVWEVYLDRRSDYPPDVAEARAWRKAGFEVPEVCAEEEDEEGGPPW